MKLGSWKKSIKQTCMSEPIKKTWTKCTVLKESCWYLSAFKLTWLLDHCLHSIKMLFVDLKELDARNRSNGFIDWSKSVLKTEQLIKNKEKSQKIAYFNAFIYILIFHICMTRIHYFSIDRIVSIQYFSLNCHTFSLDFYVLFDFVFSVAMTTPTQQLVIGKHFHCLSLKCTVDWLHCSCSLSIILH